MYARAADDFGAPHSRFQEGDRVITPSDEVAFVTGVRQGFATVRYREALSEQNAGFTIAEHYLAR